jgi:TatD DNase family protein
MQIVDSHCHINFEELASDIPGLLETAAANDVTSMLCISVTLEDYPQVLALAEEYPNIYASVGVHPNVDEGEDPSIERLVELGANEQVVAIGETGLDYFRSEGDLGWQQARFRRHIEAARQLDKPLIIHTREAAADPIEILRQEKAEQPGGVIHCFTEDWDFAKQALDIGFYISFSGILTFKSAKQIHEAAKKVPMDRILVETDSPYLAPVPHRGKTNQPAWTRHVAEFLAELRGIPIEAVAAQTTENFYRLFKQAKPVTVQ